MSQNQEPQLFQVGDVVRWKRQPLTETEFSIFLHTYVDSGRIGSGKYKITGVKDVPPLYQKVSGHPQYLTLIHLPSGRRFNLDNEDVSGWWFEK